jgi:two-component system chemotaxis sensor kinase CheA
VSLQRLIDGLRASGQHTMLQEAQRLQRLFQRRVEEVQESVLGIRMVPLSQLFDKVSVVVRQVSRDQGKDVRLLIAGGETEVDKLVAEELADPMMHLVRNAIDHGVELAGVRVGAGKPEQATLAINAYQKGSHVVVELSDDGAGIDAQRVRGTALERGLASVEALDELSSQELLHLVFTPGFSTRGAITELSGRGVGKPIELEIGDQLRQGTFSGLIADQQHDRQAVGPGALHLARDRAPAQARRTAQGRPARAREVPHELAGLAQGAK